MTCPNCAAPQGKRRLIKDDSELPPLEELSLNVCFINTANDIITVRQVSGILRTKINLEET